ncbi:MAG: glycosyltransferase family 4 protein [bacterium]
MNVYASFDPFPAPKGAATHIAAFMEALSQAYEPWTLLTVRASEEFAAQGVPRFGDNVQHVPLSVRGRTFLDRAMSFQAGLASWWGESLGERRANLAHVRSIFEGFPLARNRKDLCERFVYEVNGLPSVELKYHYPDVAEDRELLAKIHAQEQRCLEAADLVVTPSSVTAETLVKRGVRQAKLRVIPNGVDLEEFTAAPSRSFSAGPIRMLQAGTMTSWQGIEVALEALALVRREREATLTLVGPCRKRRRRELEDRARSLGVYEHLVMRKPCPPAELVRLHHESDVVLAPLLPNDRNLIQGCCPLKVLEGMASGRPVVASDLPVVQALARNGEEALLVRPASAKAIKDAVLQLDREPGLSERLTGRARRRVAEEFTWERAGQHLVDAYDCVLGLPPLSTHSR